MSFNSIAYLYFLPIVFIIYYSVKHEWRWMVLLSASYWFYMGWKPVFGLLLLFTTWVDYFTALQMHKRPTGKQRLPFLLISLFSNLGLLFYFKYFNFFFLSLTDFHTALNTQSYQPVLLNIVLPIGISFYVFQTLGYVIDVYRGKTAPQKHFGKFALFVSFFPQLVAGPIERYDNLGHQFNEKHELNPDKVISGFQLIIWGFFKKIAVADRLADFVNPVFANPSEYSGVMNLLGGLFFVIQVYCDFSGYSDIGIGSARLLGFELMENWRRPLLSKSLIEFWSRNHISLTTWFRDYIYIPLGGSRVSNARWFVNIFTVFFLSGVWHGANWTFILWGSIHGTIIILEIIFGRFLKLGKFAFAPFMWIYFIFIHTVSLIAFRAASIHDLKIMYSKIFSLDFLRFNIVSEFNSHTISWFSFLISLFCIGILLAKELREEYGWFNKTEMYLKRIRPLIYLVLFILIFLIGEFNANEFIYFQF